MNILLPKTITAAMFAAGTNIPAVDSSVGEEIWVTATNYTVGLRRVWDGYTYECVQEVTGDPQNTYNPADKRSAGYWEIDENAPTNRMAPFDKYLFTKARRAGNVTFQIPVGFATGVAVYGVEADTLDFAWTAGVAGANLIPPVHVDLWQQAFGEYEYLFGDLQRGTYFTLKNLPLHPDAHITITASRNDSGVEAAIGYISVGTWKRFLSPLEKDKGGTRYGVEVSTRDYSYTDDRKDGTYIEVEGRKATDINLSCVIDAAQAPAAKSLLDQIRGKAVAIEVSDLPRYSHMATVGKVLGTVRTNDWATAQVDIQIKGNV